MFRSKPTATAATREAQTAPPGPHLLEERGILAAWYILWRLDEELARAARYQYPLTVAVLEPQLPPGLAFPTAMVLVGAQAAQASSRAADLVGWFDDLRIVAILPHVDEAHAVAAIERWRSEITRRSWHLGGGVKWNVVCQAPGSAFQDAAAFVDTVGARQADAA